MPKAPTATVAAAALMEAGKSESVDSSFRLRSLSTTPAVKNLDEIKQPTKKLVALNFDVPALRRESQVPVRKGQLAVATEERTAQTITGKTSPKSALKDTRRKSLATKRASHVEPLQVGATSKCDEPLVSPRPQPPSAIKRRQSIAPPRSSSPVSSVSDYSTSHTASSTKRLRTDQGASVPPQVLQDAAAATEGFSTAMYRFV
ncbi:hypothetical protein MTO96_041017 [Rhipicephalus appendiculatus]